MFCCVTAVLIYQAVAVYCTVLGCTVELHSPQKLYARVVNKLEEAVKLLDCESICAITKQIAA